MSSTFSFAFEGDDIEINEDGADAAPQSPVHHEHDQDGPLRELRPPKLHSLEEMLFTLPSHLSYSHLDVPLSSRPDSLRLPRREIFDVRVQIMAESSDEDHEPILDDFEKGDLRPSIYEGGFKTWECAVDLAKVVAEEEEEWLLDGAGEGDAHVIELGAGTAMPTLALFPSALRRGRGSSEGTVRFTVCDYNDSVLRLVSMPNLLLMANEHYLFEGATVERDNNELDVEQSLHDEVEKVMAKSRINFNFVSGAWGEEFTNMVNDLSHRDDGKAGKKTLIMASETIYSPATLEAFVQTLLGLLKYANQSGSEAKALVAAKRVYFGVGGGIDEFVSQARNQGGRIRERLDVRDGGVGRVVVEVTLPVT